MSYSLRGPMVRIRLSSIEVHYAMTVSSAVMTASVARMRLTGSLITISNSC